MIFLFASGGPAGVVLFFCVKRKEPKENRLIPKVIWACCRSFLLLETAGCPSDMCFSGGFGRGFSLKSRLPKRKPADTQAYLGMQPVFFVA
ncbi:MAG: hypothetical protein J6K72_08205 [Clostridia bacterium]|nr:hypothetical protein [Clostridia bacterium]